MRKAGLIVMKIEAVLRLAIICAIVLSILFSLVVLFIPDSPTFLADFFFRLAIIFSRPFVVEIKLANWFEVTYFWSILYYGLSLAFLCFAMDKAKSAKTKKEAIPYAIVSIVSTGSIIGGILLLCAKEMEWYNNEENIVPKGENQ